jgi:putative tryptophan/tyrosine transport system substrate-binding protein
VNGFTYALEGLGWSESMNLHTETRWAADNAERYPQYARELVALEPDVILASASSSVAALQQVTDTVPIVFANVIDPVGAGFIASMAHPGGNTTGFTAFEYSISGKWLELLKQLTPGLTRVAVVREPSYAAGIGQFAAIQALALSSSSSSGIELTAIDPRNSDAIEPAIASFAREPNGWVIVTAGSSSVTHRAMLISLMLRYQLAAVYPFPYFSSAGGLVSMALTPSTFTLAPPTTSSASLKANDPPTFRCRRRPDIDWRSTSRRRRLLASRCPRRWSLSPMR